jgi:hypothetical protein
MNETRIKPDAPLYLRPFGAFKSKTLEQKVQELADREELRELIARYAHQIAHGISVDNLFTEDGAYIHREPDMPVREYRTRKAIAALYAQWMPPPDLAPKPMIHNYLLEIAGDEAAGICSNEVRMSVKGESVIGSAYYNDKFRRENGAWKFTERESVFFHMVTLQQGWAEKT